MVVTIKFTGKRPRIHNLPRVSQIVTPALITAYRYDKNDTIHRDIIITSVLKI